MILTKTKAEYNITIDKALFMRVCKELKQRSNFDIVVTSNGDNMLASAVLVNNRVYALNISFDGNKIIALLIEIQNAAIRYCEELKVFTLNDFGDYVYCNEAELSENIDLFINDIINICV